MGCLTEFVSGDGPVLVARPVPLNGFVTDARTYVISETAHIVLGWGETADDLCPPSRLAQDAGEALRAMLEVEANRLDDSRDRTRSGPVQGESQAKSK